MEHFCCGLAFNMTMCAAVNFFEIGAGVKSFETTAFLQLHKVVGLE